MLYKIVNLLYMFSDSAFIYLSLAFFVCDSMLMCLLLCEWYTHGRDGMPGISTVLYDIK